MAFLFRCPECRTRRRNQALFTQHLRETGHRLCRCGGYHFEHGPSSPFCEHNPMSPALLASRYGASDEEVAVIERELKSHLASQRREPAACPF